MRGSGNDRETSLTEYGKPLQAISTPIPGLTVWEIPPVHGDNRGWFKEKLATAQNDCRRPSRFFGPVQNNVSFNHSVGTTRGGIHAEPWDKFVSVASGRIFFGAWVDMRAGPSFGTVYSAEIDPSRAVFVPRGVGNAFQTLDPNTVYTYLVNDHYSPPDAAYTSLNLADETAGFDWPIPPLERAELSTKKDRNNPRLHEVAPDRAPQDVGRWCEWPTRTRVARIVQRPNAYRFHGPVTA